MSNKLNQTILESMPHFIAVEYKRLLDVQEPEEKTRQALRVYELVVRTLAIIMISQYLIYDEKRVNFPSLNLLFKERLPNSTIDLWRTILSEALNAYKDKPEMLVLPEMLDLIGEVKKEETASSLEVDNPFTQLERIYSNARLSAADKANLASQGKLSNTAEWQKLCSQTTELLETVLLKITFMEKYPLIRITGTADKGYYYLQLTGLKVDPSADLLETTETLNEGKLYFSDLHCRFLELHPLLIQLQDIESSIVKIPDTAIYNRNSRDQLEYLIVRFLQESHHQEPSSNFPGWETIRTHNMFDDFLHLMDFVIEQVKIRIKSEVKEELRAELAIRDATGSAVSPRKKLSFAQMSQLFTAISSSRMASVSNKYQTDVYLQRNKIVSAFERFLTSDKVAFVLTGKSGAGKSNFLLSLPELYASQSTNVVLLIYNGAKLDPNESLTQVIKRDIESYLNYTLDDIWLEIGSIDGIQENKVIICIDAVNENTEAKEVMKQIDRLIEDAHWPWLKVVITSRSEAWRVIKRGLHLAEAKYYRETDDERLDIEMQPFVIDPFSRDELREVFEKYRIKYRLQTTYENIAPEVRTALRDPLILYLVAEIHQDNNIPKTLKVEDIYQDYMDHLIESGRLTEDDVRFLEHELMPLMIREQSYSNAITAGQIDEGLTSDGRSIYELIHNATKRDRMHQVNQSYVNLLECDILTRHGSARNYIIQFKYERFYDHFAARRIQQLLQGSEFEQYQHLLSRLDEAPFLWGAIHHILTRQLFENNSSLVSALAYQRHPAIQKMITQVLTEYAQSALAGRDSVESILKNIIYDKIPVLIKKQKLSPDQITAAKTIAVDTAMFLELIDVLATAGNDKSPVVRTQMVRLVSGAWKPGDFDLSLKALTALKDKSVGRFVGLPIPRPRGLESLIMSLAIIGGGHHSDADSAAALQTIISDTLNDVLPVRLDSPIGGIFRSLISIVYRLVGYQVIYRVSRGSEYNPASMDEIGSYFRRPLEHRMLINDLLPIFYPESGPVKSHFETLRKIMAVNDPNMNLFSVWTLIRRSLTEPEDTAQIIFDLFDELIEVKQPACQTFTLIQLGIVTLIKSIHSEDPKQAEALFVEYKKQSRRYMDKTRGRVYYQREYLFEVLENVIRLSYELYRDVDFDFIHEYLLRARHEEDWKLLNAHCRGMFLVGIEYPYPALQALTVLLMDEDINAAKAVAGAIVRIRMAHPDIVDEFLAEHDLSKQIREQILIANAQEDIEDVSVSATGNFIVSGILNSPFLLDSVVLMVGQMPYMRNVKQWILTTITHVANIAYQQNLFKVKMNPVDVGHKIIRSPFEKP